MTYRGAFKDKLAIVTGGASGIGRALCRDLAAAGARVLVADLNLTGAEAVAAEIGGQARELDVRDARAFRELVESAAAAHGRLDYLFNNAGIGVAGDARDFSDEHWRETVEINLMGVVNGCQAAYPLMARQGSGHLVNVASLAGLIGAPGMLPYATTKAAVIGLSRTLRVEARALGVKVSVVCPGFIESNIYESSRSANLEPGKVRSLVGLPILPTEKASREILAGVLANQEVIVFPGYARVLWGLSQICPPLLGALGQDMIDRMRRRRIKD